MSASDANDEDARIASLLAIKLKLSGYQYGGAKLDKGGSYQVTASKVEVGNFLLKGSYESFDIQWQDLHKLPFGNGVDQPVERMHRLRLQSHIPYRFSPGKLILNQVAISATYEKEMDHAFSYQLYSLYSEDFSRLGSLQFGLYANIQPVQTVIYPIFEYTYNYASPSKEGIYGHLGFPKTQVGYHLTPKWRAEFAAVYHQAIGKLSKQNALQPSGYIQSKNWRGVLAVHHQLTKSVELSLGLHANLTNQLVLFNQQHQRLDHYYINEGAGLSLAISQRF